MGNAWKVNPSSSCLWLVLFLFYSFTGMDVNTSFLLFSFQEKGNIDVAIRYYLTAIEVCVISNYFLPSVAKRKRGVVR